MLDTILLATDFRPASMAAIEATEMLAEAFGSRIALLHVFHAMHVHASAEEQRELAEWELRELARRLSSKGFEVSECMVLAGHPASRIVKEARERKVDLVVIGAGRWSGDSAFLAGPIAEAVLHHSSQPVLAVRPGNPTLTFRKILCPVDQSEVSKRGLLTSIGLAKAFYSDIHVVSVVPETGWVPAALETGHVTDAVEMHKRKWREEFNQFVGSLEFDNVACKRETRVGIPHEEILASAAEHHADLIVMGSTGKTGLASLLMGSVARRVLQRLPCSLLTVKADNLVPQVIHADQDFINCLMAQGQALLDAGSCYASAAKFRQVLTHDPFYAPALESLAELHRHMGQGDLADECERRAGLILHTHSTLNEPHCEVAGSPEEEASCGID